MRLLPAFRPPVHPLRLLLRQPRRLCTLSIPRSCLRSSAVPDGGAAEPGSLYLVSTPIGNVSDITFRAVSILSSVDIIAAEDTRRTGLLLKSILPRPRSAQLLSHHEHNARARTPQLISRLQSRASIALVSDAGTPCISDPGHFLVSAAAAAGIRVIPVPGACAALSALVVTGFALSTFAFVGFLPRSGSARTASLARVAASDGAVVIYEAPGRVRGTIDALEGVVGDREVVVAREITKKFEEVRRFASVSEAAVEYAECEDEPRGEFVIVVGPAKSVRKMEGVHDEMETADVNVRGMARALLEEGVPVKAIAKSIGSVANLSKKAVYKYVSDLKDEMLLSPTPARNT